MSTYSRKINPLTRESIIGLGESSFRKNYYPELQDNINTLEKMRSRNQALMMAIPDILLISNASHHMTPFSTSSKMDASLFLNFLRNKLISACLNEGIDQVLDSRSPEISTFSITVSNEEKHFEARFQLTEQGEVLIIIRDMTERISFENKLRVMTETDSSTGLYNRRKFEEAVMSFENNTADTLALIVFDIDGLKNINDTLGHFEGDKVIEYVATTLKTCFKEAAILSRIGGNEFGAIYVNVGHKLIEEKCETFQRHIAELNEAMPYEISVSFGISYSNSYPIRFSQLYQLADHNMYNHKLLKESSGKSGLVKALMKTLEAKDYITEGHADRMTVLASELGHMMQLEQHRLDQLTLLTKFHDLGKVGIPDNILKKEGPLTPDEWDIMKTHTTIGQRIASASPELMGISNLICKHHEKWDGTGYPLGLSGIEIPLECRILSLVDAFDAMTNDRPYRKAISHDEAINEVLLCSGTQFDPDLVVKFLEYFKKNPI